MLAQLDFPRRPVAAPRRSLDRRAVRRRRFASKIPDYIFGSYIDEVLMVSRPNALLEKDKKLFYSTNDLYSAYALTDSTGTVVERYMYDPYGACTVLAADGVTVRTESLYGNSHTFTGRTEDKETGLLYFRNRMYSVDLGRFIGRDPIGYDSGQNWPSLYLFVFSQPTTFVDPTGLCPAGFVPLTNADKTTIANSSIGTSSSWWLRWKYPDPDYLFCEHVGKCVRKGKPSVRTGTVVKTIRSPNWRSDSENFNGLAGPIGFVTWKRTVFVVKILGTNWDILDWYLCCSNVKDDSATMTGNSEGSSSVVYTNVYDYLETQILDLGDRYQTQYEETAGGAGFRDSGGNVEKQPPPGVGGPNVPGNSQPPVRGEGGVTPGLPAPSQPVPVGGGL